MAYHQMSDKKRTQAVAAKYVHEEVAWKYTEDEEALKALDTIHSIAMHPKVGVDIVARSLMPAKSVQLSRANITAFQLMNCHRHTPCNAIQPPNQNWTS